MSCVVVCCAAKPPLPFHDRAFEDDNGLVKGLMHELGDRNLRTHRSLCVLLILLLAFAITLSLQLTHTVEWKWAAVFSPLYAAFTMLICFPKIFRIDNDWDGNEKYKICAAFWVVIYLPILLFIILLNVKLDTDTYVPMALVMLPFWYPLFRCGSLILNTHGSWLIRRDVMCCMS